MIPSHLWLSRGSYHFNTRNCHGRESISTYVAELQHLSECCNFETSLNKMLCDWIVWEIEDQSIQQRLLAELELTFDKALELALTCVMVVCDWIAAQLMVIFLLLLISGNVHPNLGPVKFLCIICCKPVTSNQDGVECSTCYLWCHQSCDGISKEEYITLLTFDTSDDDWFCCHRVPCSAS